MTDPAPSESSPPQPPVPSSAGAARQRFLVISLFRLSGALILVFGIAIAQRHFGWVQGEKARIMGAIVVAVGFIQMMLVPRMLLRAFATPPGK